MRIIIKAIKTEKGWRMVDEDGNYPQEGRLHTTEESVYADCEAMYGNSTWQGRRTKAGYSIEID